MRRFNNRLLVVGFLTILAAPTLASLCRLRPLEGLDEKRELAKPPSFAHVRWRDMASIASFAQGWEKYYVDNFGLRKLLVGSYRLAMFHLLKISPNPAVVIGEWDGHTRWLYFEAAAANNGAGFDGFLGKVPYTQAQLAAIAANLARLSKLFADNHTSFLFVVCPDKQSIYPEYLPRNLRPVPGKSSRLDQLSEIAQGVLGSHYLDLRAALRKAKLRERMYFPADTHWNHKAGLLVYQEVMQALQQQDPTRVPLPSSAVRWEKLPLVTVDLMDLGGFPSFSQEPFLAPILPTPDVPRGRRRGKLLVFHDSYFREFLQRYFEFEFAEVKVTYGAHKPTGVFLTQAELSAEKPDVVVIESAERFWTW
jgi:hypothetical protein